MRQRLLMAAAAVVIMTLVCSGLSAKQGLKQIPKGVWGGPGIRIQVENGSASIEYDCASGTMSGALKLDRKGRFKLSGTHTREHGGPIRLDRPPTNQAARYTGWTDGKKMTLVVTLAETNDQVGTFTLERGQTGRIHKCR